MPDPWTFSGEPAAGGDVPGTVTLLDGTTFCISTSNGDIEANEVHGLFVRDTRVVSSLRLLFDGQSPQCLSTVQMAPFATKFVSRLRPGPDASESSVVVVRTRCVGEGMREDLVVKNLGATEFTCTLTIEITADFADVFEVKEERVRLRGFHSAEVVGDKLIYTSKEDAKRRSVAITIPEGADAGPGTVQLPLKIAPREQWSTCMEFRVSADGREVPLQHPCGAPVARSEATERLMEWRWQTPRVELAPEVIAQALRRSEEDLGALRIFDEDHPDEPIMAAGAPWFMALFGRDSLFTSYMTLAVDPAIALGTMRKLARHQGRRVVPDTNEQPGRILHEMRARLGGRGGALGTVASYGSIDSTPLFVMLFGEAWRWGIEKAVVEELLPHVDRAMAWIAEYGDADHDGFVEYERSSDAGLVNQGWKDSTNAITFANGEAAIAPIALCEVQGYVYAAYRARHQFALSAGDHKSADHYARLGRKLKKDFNEAFYLEDRGYVALGLDKDKRPIDALASNMGHCLWTGIVDERHAPKVVDKLMSPELFSGFGIRTLATTMAVFNPMGYHTGAVWPHDNAVCAAGLMAYGFIEESQRLVNGLLEASSAFSGRLPECFCGFSKDELERPVAYPTSCSPQAWAAATPYSLVRTLLRFDPDLPKDKVHFSPAIPSGYGALRLGNIPLDGERVTVSVGGEDEKVEGLGEDTALVTDEARTLELPEVGS